MSLPRVKVVVLGGTITMAPSAQAGITPTLSGEALLAQIPSLKEIASLDVVTPFLKPGASITLTEIAELAQGFAQDDADGIAGIVMVQGTDTIDETSFLIDLLYQGHAPVIVTGAMRGAHALSADGPSNLHNAISAAADPKTRDLGCLVLLNEELHTAANVEKMHKGLVSSFQSPNGGPIGYFLEGRLRLLRRPQSRPNLRLAASSFPTVCIAKPCLDENPALLNALPSLGYSGVVVEAMGVGHVPGQVLDALHALTQSLPVVLASRVTGGPVYTNTYGFPGSEIDLIKRLGLIPAGWLSPQKARLLLTLCLASGMKKDDIESAFAQFDPR
ncbi:asparaginase [Pusillimonas sp. CC-YST705]|uniref:Asparaginase n=1 Tax=Mesopusillimonas faecipullorum TaxID=2755040 RepID=A0ABS8C8P9_9BURK|nr:asparaginase [Mesopusillimonas faecipullorum]MCB5362406.1 asparaginase [Mesopusillimonas faecipullorum]